MTCNFTWAIRNVTSSILFQSSLAGFPMSGFYSSFVGSRSTNDSWNRGTKRFHNLEHWKRKEPEREDSTLSTTRRMSATPCIISSLLLPAGLPQVDGTHQFYHFYSQSACLSYFLISSLCLYYFIYFISRFMDLPDSSSSDSYGTNCLRSHDLEHSLWT